MQPVQARGATAEVVDREPEPLEPEPSHDITGAHGVDGELCFAHFDCEYRRFEAAHDEQLLEAIGKVEVLQRARGQVDGDRMLVAGFPPACDESERFVEHKCRQSADQRGRLLGHRHERLGVEHTGRRMAPAHQCLGARQLTGSHADLRLVDEEELMAVERLLQFVRRRSRRRNDGWRAKRGEACEHGRQLVRAERLLDFTEEMQALLRHEQPRRFDDPFVLDARDNDPRFDA